MKEGETKALREINIFLCYFNDPHNPLFFSEEFNTGSLNRSVREGTFFVHEKKTSASIAGQHG